MPLPFALDHINLWPIEEPASADDPRDGWTVVDTGFGVEATRALWEQHFAQTWAASRSHRGDALPPGPSGQCAMAGGALCDKTRRADRGDESY